MRTLTIKDLEQISGGTQRAQPGTGGRARLPVNSGKNSNNYCRKCAVRANVIPSKDRHGRGLTAVVCPRCGDAWLYCSYNATQHIPLVYEEATGSYNEWH